MMEIFADFTFEAAHRLPGVPAEHRCARTHGHSYRVRVVVRGDVEPSTGFVVDFANLDHVFEAVRAEIDHRCLNDVPGLENPTSERVAQWLWRRLRPSMPGLTELRLHETPHAGAIYRGEDD